MKNAMKVLFVAAEASHLIKVGGLGDVAGELPLKLAQLGLDVRVIIPAYQDIDATTRYLTDFPVDMGFRTETCILREACQAPVHSYLVDNYHYFGRPGVYGYRDDAERYAFFCLSVYKLLGFLDFKPDVIHLNDWHTAPLAMLIRENEKEIQDISSISTVFSIHNLEYQGTCGRNVFSMYGVKDIVFDMDKVEYYGCFNPMKAGLNYADRISCVSKTYASEILTPQWGFGLDGVVQKNKSRLTGIINGIDTKLWDPEMDSALTQNYSIETIERKSDNKIKLRQELSLETSQAPLCGAILRLVAHKGVELLEGVAEAIVREGGQFVILGKGDKYYEHALRRLEERYPGKMAARFEYNAVLARRIYAASDMFLMPSRYEPCGLSQLIAMRYGTVPIVHRTGGLADTVIDQVKHAKQGTGFVFGTYSLEAFTRAIRKAFKLFTEDKEGWNDLIKRGMSRDSSWEGPARDYIELYQEAVKANCLRQNKGGRPKLDKAGENKEDTSHAGPGISG